MGLKRRAGNAGSAGRLPGQWSRDDVMALKFPDLTAFLAQTAWDDGAPRTTGTVLVFVDEGVLKACLSDRDGRLVAFVSSDTLAGLLEALDGGLGEDSLDWRPMRDPGGKRRRSS